MEFKDNPFFILNVSFQDSKEKIQDKSEEKSLELSEEYCRNAGRILINPKKRLEAEIGWFPGVSQRLIGEITKAHNRITYRRVLATVNEVLNRIPILTCTNIIAFFMSQIDENTPNINDICKLFHIFFQLVNKLESTLNETVKLINFERTSSGFAEIQQDEYFQEIINNQIQLYCKIANKLLKSLDFKYRVNVITTIVINETSNGNIVCESVIFENLIKEYEFESEVISSLDNKEDNINKTIDFVSVFLKTNRSDNDIFYVLQELKRLVIEWDKIAQPIQLFYRSQGVEHKRSSDLFNKLRHISIDAYNKHNKIKISQQLTELQKQVFAESRDASDQISKDEKSINEIIHNKQSGLIIDEKFKKKIEYYNEWGLLFKKSVKISFDKIIVNHNNICNFDEAVGIRWGLTRRYTNGRLSGITYTVSIDRSYSVLEIPIQDDKMFNDVVDRLIKTVGVKILTNYLELLKKGKYIIIDGLKIFDDGMELRKSKFLFMSEVVRVPWNNIYSCYSKNGSFIIEGTEENVGASFVYQEVFNTHILEIMLNTLIEKGVNSITKAFSN